MRRTERLQGLRFEDVYGRFQKGRLDCEAASELLGISVSSFRRRRRRYEEDGVEGLADRRLGKLSWRRAPADEVSKVLEVFETRYLDFTVKHFHEKLKAEHGIERSYSWTKNTLQAAGTNAIERRFREMRRRTRPMGVFQDRTSMDRILFAVFTHENSTLGVPTLFSVTQTF